MLTEADREFLFNVVAAGTKNNPEAIEPAQKAIAAEAKRLQKIAESSLKGGIYSTRAEIGDEEATPASLAAGR